MEFRFNVNEIFTSSIIEIGPSLLPPGIAYNDKRALWDAVNKVAEVVNAMGEASAAAQGLTKPITTSDRLRNSEQKVYLLVDKAANNGKGAVTGMLKTGRKGLYVFDREGHHYQVQPSCILDFYIHESKQRMGLGKQLFEHMLTKEKVEPVKLAIDRPSDKLLGFLNKHYALNNPVRQVNNFVVFEGFFPESVGGPTKGDNLDAPTTKSNQAANGLQSSFTTPYGRYGTPRPPCSMGQIIHKQSPLAQAQEPTGTSLNIRPAQKLRSQTAPSEYHKHISRNFSNAVCLSTTDLRRKRDSQNEEDENLNPQYQKQQHLPRQIVQGQQFQQPIQNLTAGAQVQMPQQVVSLMQESQFSAQQGYQLTAADIMGQHPQQLPTQSIMRHVEMQPSAQMQFANVPQQGQMQQYSPTQMRMQQPSRIQLQQPLQQMTEPQHYEQQIQMPPPQQMHQQFQQQRKIPQEHLQSHSQQNQFRAPTSQPIQTSAQIPPIIPQLQPAIPQSQQVFTQPQQVVVQPQQAVAQPQQVISQPHQVVAQPQQVVVQPQRVVAQPQPVVTQPQQVVVQPPPTQYLQQQVPYTQHPQGLIQQGAQQQLVAQTEEKKSVQFIPQYQMTSTVPGTQAAYQQPTQQTQYIQPPYEGQVYQQNVQQPNQYIQMTPKEVQIAGTLENISTPNQHIQTPIQQAQTTIQQAQTTIQQPLTPTQQVQTPSEQVQTPLQQVERTIQQLQQLLPQLQQSSRTGSFAAITGGTPYMSTQPQIPVSEVQSAMQTGTTYNTQQIQNQATTQRHRPQVPPTQNQSIAQEQNKLAQYAQSQGMAPQTPMQHVQTANSQYLSKEGTTVSGIPNAGGDMPPIEA